MNFIARDNADDELIEIEKRIRNILNPVESWLMSIQSLLVWENRMKSAVLLVCLHGLFWFLACSSCHFYSIVTTTIIIVYLIHTWKRRIWPEIRVPPKQPEDTDGWTQVHPRLLSVPELCSHLAAAWFYTARCGRWWLTLRRTRPFKFCIEASFILTALAVIGHYVSGIVLSYILMMTVVLWPCIKYHNLWNKLYLKFQPVFQKLDFSAKVKKKFSHHTASTPTIAVYPIEGIDDDITTTTNSVSPDPESDLDEFYPLLNPALSAALARAATDSDEEPEEPSSFTPHLSKEPSLANSEDDEQVNDDDFLLSVDAMPSIEDSLEHTDDELLAPESNSREKSVESIKFIPSHFNDSSDSDEDTVRHDSHPSASAAPPTDLAKALTENLMAQALKSVMTTALQNLTGHTAEQSQNNSALQDRVAYTRSDSDDEFDLEPDNVRVRRQIRQRPVSQDSGDINIDDEFEFLDEYDLGDSQEK